MGGGGDLWEQPVKGCWLPHGAGIFMELGAHSPVMLDFGSLPSVAVYHLALEVLCGPIWMAISYTFNTPPHPPPRHRDISRVFTLGVGSRHAHLAPFTC